MRRRILLTILCLVAGPVGAEELKFKDRLVGKLAEQVPAILKGFDAETGRFGSGIWICQDQHDMYPLAVAYTTPGPANPYHKDASLLEVIMKAGDALIADADERGQWVFRKKDGSTWGKIWMPWTYSRWARTFGLIRDDMPPQRRKAWADALLLGFTGISNSQLRSIHNIPAHHAMGLYAAGQALDRPEWCHQAAEFMVKVAGHQSPAGYWAEGGGPVVLYNFVYVDALGTYHAMSGDERVLPALDKAAAYHRHFTYPSGQDVETIDQRNAFHDRVSPGNVGFTFSPTGRAFLKNQWARSGERGLSADLIASLLLYGQEGPADDVDSGAADGPFVLNEGGADRAATLRRGPWFVCLSAYTGPIVKSRWIQDRQSFASVFHDRVGLILGGGNTKLQPAWSSFTVGDASLLAHKPGDENPDFLPQGELYHVPTAAKLLVEPHFGLDLTYGQEVCRVRINPLDEQTLEYQIESTTNSSLPVAAHLTLIPRLGKPLETAGGQKLTLDDKPLTMTPDQLGGELTHAGFRITVPDSATLHWPTLPHNPYRKDGRATAAEGRLTIRVPLDQDHPRHKIVLHVP